MLKSLYYSFLTALVFVFGGFGSLLAQTETQANNEPAPPAQDSGLWQTIIMLAIFIAFFYIIMWRPEQKRRKALEQQRSSLKKGDRVIAMGIIGTVTKITDQSAILKMVDGSRIEVLKGAITEILPESEGEGKSETKNEPKVEPIPDDEGGR